MKIALWIGLGWLGLSVVSLAFLAWLFARELDG